MRDGRKTAHLVVGREADTELLLDAVLAALCLLGAEPVEIEHLEQLVERRVVVARIDRQPRCERERELGDEVLAAELQPIHAELVGEIVHRPLDHVGRLGTSRAPVRVGRRRVREDARELDAVVRDRVRPRVDPGAEKRDPRRDELEVRAHRGRDPGAAVRDRAVLLRSERVLGDEVPAVDRRDVVLRALLDPFHGSAEAAAEGEREELLGVDVELRAEAAADVGRDDADLRFVEAERRRDEHAQDVRDLRRRVERHVARGAGKREYGARLDRVRDEPRLVVAPRHDDVGVLELLARGVRVQPPDVALVRTEIRMDERNAVVQRLRHVRDRVERLPVDVDKLGGVLRLGAGLGDHNGDAVSLVARDFSERVVRRVLHLLRDGPCARHRRLPVVPEVRGRERRDDPVGRLRRREVDRRHAGMRERAADDGHEHRSDRRHVVDVCPAPGEKRLVLAALHRRADVRGLRLGGAHDALPIAVAASFTARTMLW